MRFITIWVAFLFIGSVSAADGDVRKTTVDGLEWTYSILNETNKTCQVGAVAVDSWGEKTGVPAIDANTTGAITIPSVLDGYTVVAISYQAFRESKISSVIVPSSVERIEEKAYFRCEQLTSVSLSEGLTFIGEEVFSECPISAITLPESLVRIGEQAFEETLLTTIFLPKNVAFLGNEDKIDEWGNVTEEDDLYGDVFCDCELLAEVKVDEANNTYADIDGVLVAREKMILLYFPPAKQQNFIPEGIEEINANAFEDSEITSIYFPSTLKYIGESAFQYSALTSVAIGFIPEPMTRAHAQMSSSSSSSITIGTRAFASCDHLKTVFLGENVSELQNGVFAYCGSLTDVYNYSPVPQTIDQETFAMSYESDDNWETWYPVCTATLHVLSGCKSAYENAEGWSLFNEIVDDADKWTDGVSSATSADTEVVSCYTLMGTRTSGHKGLVIFKTSDGMCRKMLSK